MKPFIAFLAFITAVAVHAADVTEIKLATILPAGTTSHQCLMELRDAWLKASGGTVKLTVYPGAGDGEIALVRRMRARQLQAALVSVVGLGQIDRAATCLQVMPMTFRDWREVDYVRENLRTELEQGLRAKDFEVLFWADAGWVRFFSRHAAVRPADMKPMKMFVWSGEPHQLSLLRKMGYNPVGLETEQILPALSTGMLDVVPVPPFLANALQYNRYVSHMVELNWVPIVGAAVVRRDTWEKIPAALRTELLKAAAATGERLRVRNRAEDDAAIAAMQKRGLTVHRLPAAAIAEWQASVKAAQSDLRGPMVPAELFDRVHATVAEFRSREGGNE